MVPTVETIQAASDFYQRADDCCMIYTAKYNNARSTACAANSNAPEEGLICSLLREVVRLLEMRLVHRSGLLPPWHNNLLHPSTEAFRQSIVMLCRKASTTSFPTYSRSLPTILTVIWLYESLFSDSNDATLLCICDTMCVTGNTTGRLFTSIF